MKTRANILLYVILFGVIVYLFLRQPAPPPPQIIVKTDTITLVRTHYIPKAYIIYRDTGSHSVSIIHDTFRIPVDTGAILADYRRRRVYIDTLLDDSTGFVRVVDTVQFNRIMNRAKNISIISYQKTIHHSPTWHLYAGAGIGGGKNTFGFRASIFYQDKKSHLFGFDYDFLQKNIFVSVCFRLK